MARSNVATSERLEVEHYAATAEGFLIYLIHIVAYRWFALDCDDREVLDFGCGTGYGSSELAQTAKRVVGVDISSEAIAHSKKAYDGPNISFFQIAPVETEDLPFEADSFDVVVSNQVIEHFSDPRHYLLEARRVLRPGGTLFVVTPDRDTRLFPLQKPWNRFHYHEYRPDDLGRAIGRFFDHVEILGMTGEPDVIAREIRRTKLIRILTLPFTYGPEGWRQFGLSVLALLKRSDGNPPPEFGDDAVWISENAHPSVNVCVRAF